MESIPELIYDRPRSCWIEVNLDALVHNLGLIKDQFNSELDLLAVVKAEAYGHGAEMIARTLADNGVDYLAVATLEEAIKLREFGIDSRILIMGHMATFNVDIMLDYACVPFVFSYRLLHAINEEAQQRNQVAPVHLKIDTGMGRLGILPANIEDYLRELSDLDHVRLEGVATHFADAGQDKNYTNTQIKRFHTLREHVHNAGFSPDYWHCMNSAAVFSREESVGNLLRPGITLYGYKPTNELPSIDLQPVMQVKTKMADYKQIPAGRGVSYGRLFQPEEPTWIGVLPLGYADGYSRSFSQKAHVLKDGQKRDVLGNVCMDMTVIRLDENDDPEQTVTIMGEDGNESIWADTMAEWDETIPYEILCSFSERLPRIYERNNEAVALKTEQGIKQL